MRLPDHLRSTVSTSAEHLGGDRALDQDLMKPRGPSYVSWNQKGACSTLAAISSIEQIDIVLWVKGIPGCLGGRGMHDLAVVPMLHAEAGRRGRRISGISGGLAEDRGGEYRALETRHDALGGT